MPDGSTNSSTATSIVVMWTVGPDDVAEGDRILACHLDWMAGHPREGRAALLSYRVVKGAELTDPVDPTSDETGNTIFVLTELYATPDGVAEHWRAATDTWKELPEFLAWSRRVEVATLHSGALVGTLR